jgi:hypothetical protein
VQYEPASAVCGGVGSSGPRSRDRAAGRSLVRRQYKNFPVFTFYIAFNLLTDRRRHAGRWCFEKLGRAPWRFACLLPPILSGSNGSLEIAWHVLRPVQVSLPHGTASNIRLVHGSLCWVALCWPGMLTTGSLVYDKIKRPSRPDGEGLLRMLIFVVTAGFRPVAGDRLEKQGLQLATALSFYSAVDLIVSLVQRHSGPIRDLERIAGWSTSCFELGFLVWAFTTKDVRRREFSPQMEQFLVTLAGRAKLARTALVRMQVK